MCIICPFIESYEKEVSKKSGKCALVGYPEWTKGHKQCGLSTTSLSGARIVIFGPRNFQNFYSEQ